MDIDKAGHPLHCEGCNKKLLNVFIKDNTLDQTYQIQAKCPYCVKSSAIHSFHGLCHVGTYAEESSRFPVKIVDINEENGVFIYKLRKA